MSYQPKPVDTSRIELTQLEGLSEYLAEQAHEIWAQQRIREGWSYGKSRNDDLKQTPDLLPYAQLPDSERDYDRKMSAHTLKLILDQGYQLNLPEERVPAFAGKGPEIADSSEMEDQKELAWLKERANKGEGYLQPYIDRLEWLGGQLTPAFDEADKTADRYREQYLRASFWCVLCGGLAVFLAIYQVAKFPTFGAPVLTLPFVEFCLVVISVLLVWLDFHYGWRDSWLAYRARAERLRGLKFRSLVDPALWSSVTRAEAEAKIGGAARAIQSIRPDHLEGHMADADLDPPVPGVLSGNSQVDYAIGNYYLRRRLIAQSEYAEKKEHEYHHADQKTKVLGITFFFLVLLFVFAHNVLDGVKVFSQGNAAAQASASKSSEPPKEPVDDPSESVSRALIACAAFFPAASAALRVYRSGREAGRNHLRTHAMFKRLSRLREQLEGCGNRKEQIRLMIQSEVTLASEHEQWLQLMKECEWYG